MPTGEVYINMKDSATLINTTQQTTPTTKMHSLVICGIPTALVSERSTELSKGAEVVSSRFQAVKYCLIQKTELVKTEVVSSLEIVSSRFKIVE